MRLMSSPAEGLEVEAVVREPGGAQRVADQLGPGLGSTDEDLALGDVGDPAAQGARVVDARVDPVREPRAVVATGAWEVEESEPALGRQIGQLGVEQRLPLPPVQQHTVAGGDVETLCQRADRGDPDAGADQGHLRPDPGPGAEPAERALEPDPGPAAQVERGGAAVADSLDGDPQGAAVGGGREGVRVGAGPARTPQEPEPQELAGLDPQPVEATAGQADRHDVVGLA